MSSYCSHAGSQFSRAGSVPHKKRPPKLANKVRLCRVGKLPRLSWPSLPSLHHRNLTDSSSNPPFSLPALFCFLSLTPWGWGGGRGGVGIEQGRRHPKSTIFCCVLSSWSLVITSGPRPGLHQSALSAGNYHCSGGGHGLQVTCLLGSGEADLETGSTQGVRCAWGPGSGVGGGKWTGDQAATARVKVGCLVRVPL